MGKAISKKKRAHSLFQDSLHVFKCPLCGQPFLPGGQLGLRCVSNHNFDLAKSGYLNLLPAASKTEYSRELFLARRAVFALGIYDPLFRRLSSLAGPLREDAALILDAGCGEGSTLDYLLPKTENARLLGVDISKEAIRLAAAGSAPIIWCVADLAELPLQTGVADLILNMLAPANFKEFRRVLKRAGMLLKVLPGADYLREIRGLKSDAPQYSNQAVIDNLKSKVSRLERERLRYKVPIQREWWPILLAMTPLARHSPIEAAAPKEITIDLEIISAFFA